MCYNTCMFLEILLKILSIFLLVGIGYFVYKIRLVPYDALNESVQENVSAIRVVKSFVREEYEKSRFEKAVLQVYELFVRAERTVITNGPVMMGAVYACILLLSWFGAKMIVAGGLTTGELMSLLAYCMNILVSLMMVSMIFVMLTMSEASMERIALVLDEQITLKNPENPDYDIPDGAVKFDHVTFSYSEKAEKPVLPGRRSESSAEREAPSLPW